MAMSDLVLLFLVGCANLLLAVVGLIVSGPSMFLALIALLGLAVCGAAGGKLAAARWARRTTKTTPPRYPLRALDQTEYAELLQADRDHERLFRARNGIDRFQCGRCHRPAFGTAVRHPIWDGPFDEAGSDKVDVRVFSWCTACDGPPPAQEGPAIRLPYLDNLPIRLLPELFNRPVFRALPMPVELYVPPPPAPAEVAGPTQETPS